MVDNILQLYQFRDKIASGYCNLTVDAVYLQLFGRRKLETDIRPLAEEVNETEKYVDYVIANIAEQLDTHGLCIIELRDSPGAEALLIHTFILFLIDNHIYRLESYGKSIYSPKGDNYETLYSTRIVEWPTYLSDLRRLINMDPGTARVWYWNGLFSAEETDDLYENPLDVILVIPPQ